jgi:hypothetical protein
MMLEIFKYTYGKSSTNNDHNGGRSSCRNNDNNHDVFLSDNDDNDDNYKNGNIISESNDDHGNNNDNDSILSNSRNSSFGPIIDNDRRSNINSDINNNTSDGNKINNDNHCINHNHNKSSNINNNSYYSNSSDNSRSSSSSNNNNQTSNHDRIKQLYIDYMDGISLLQCIDINSIINITEFEKLCLFLNLYHCLLLHSYIIFNYPLTILKFVSFNCHCSYEIFGDILSLAELEHNIIKYSMPKPDINFIAQFYIPKSKFNFHVNILDYRILWSIYCYAITNIHEIPIYTKDKLNMQLNYMVEKSLMSSIIIKKQKLSSSSCVIYLPIICQWYAKVIISSLTEIMKINFYEYYYNQFINNINNNDSNGDIKITNSSSVSSSVECGIGVKYYDAPSFMALMNSLSKHKQMLLVLWQHLR